MKKILVVFFAVISLTLSSINPSSAADRAGKSCSKHQATSTYAGKKYICIKSGKRLVWNKGVAISLAAAVLSAPVVAPVLLPTPPAAVPEQVAPTQEPISKNEVPEAKKELTAYDKVVDYTKSLKTNNSVSLYISENAKERDYSLYLTGIDEIASLWNPILKDSKFSVVIFTEKDSQWADDIQTRLMGPFLNNPREQLQSYRLKDAGCNIYGFYLPGVLVFCVKDNQGLQNIGSKFSALHAIGHEYSHLAGMTGLEFSQLPLGDKRRLKPCWIEEGGATFWGISMAHTSKSYTDNGRVEFIRQLTTNIDHRLGSKHGTFMDSIQNSSTSEFVGMMKKVEVTLDYCTTNPIDIPSAYFLGMFATEYLVNNFGVEKVINFNGSISGVSDWKTIFFKYFNMTTDEFYIKLDSYIKERVVEFDIIR